MTNQTIKQILKEKGILRLYHANRVETTCTYLENGGLLSRGAVDDRGLCQTPQQSDETDQEVDVYYDIFLDSVDIHQRSRNLNKYGPITFVYFIDVIDALPEGAIRITKDNPIRWKAGMSEAEKYFLGEEELRAVFQKGNFAQHFTIRHQTEPLPFDCLEKIIIDDPGVEDTTHFERACQHLQQLMAVHAPKSFLEVRKCAPGCRCQETYRSYKPGAIYHRFGFR